MAIPEDCCELLVRPPLRLLLLAVLSQLLCAWDTRTFARDMWLLLPDMDEEGSAEARYGMATQACDGALVAPLDLAGHYASEHPWGSFPLATVAQLEKLAGRPVWSRNPIASSKDLDRDDGQFAQVNPSFVRWARSSLLPGVTDSAFRAATMSRYQACLSPGVRQLWAVRQDLRSAPTCKAKVLAQYRQVLLDGSSRGLIFGSWEWAECLGMSTFDLDESLEARVGDLSWRDSWFDLSYGKTLSWWLRRELDGSAAELDLSLKAILRAYDPAWLAAHGKEGFVEDSEARYQEWLAARARRGELGGADATDAALARARGHSSKALRADWDRRAEASFAVCGAYYTELAQRKATIYKAMEAGDEDAVQAAVRDVDGWASGQMYGDAPLARALEDLRLLVEEVQEAAGRGAVSDAEAIGFISTVQRRCGG